MPGNACKPSPPAWTHDPPRRLAALDVLDSDRPGSGVLRLWLADNTRIVLRPSGTETKFKYYCEAVEPVASRENPERGPYPCPPAIGCSEALNCSGCSAECVQHRFGGGEPETVRSGFDHVQGRGQVADSTRGLHLRSIAHTVGHRAYRIHARPTCGVEPC